MWSTTRVYSWPFVIKYFLVWLILDNEQTDFASYTDDNTPYVLEDILDDVIESLKDDSINLFKWYLDNQMTAIMQIKAKNEVVWIWKCGIQILKTNNTCKKLLQVKVDKKLNFNKHLDEIIKTLSRNFIALSWIFLIINLTKRRFFMNSFFTS